MQQKIEKTEGQMQVANVDRKNFDVHNILDIGKRAVQDWKNGDGAIARGQQRAIYCVALAWHEVEFCGVIQKKDGTIEEQWVFDLEDYMHSEPKKADGTKDNKKSQAQHVAVFKTLFGIDEPTGNQKTRIKSALQVVDYIYNQKGYDETDILWNEKSSRLEVPFEVIEPEPKEDADDEAKKKYKAMKGETVGLTGKRGRAVADLERLARPKREESGASSNTPDQGKQLKSSTIFITQYLKNLLDEKAMANAPAPNKELRKELWALSEFVTLYFEKDGLTKEEEAEFIRKEEDKKNTGKRKAS